MSEEREKSIITRREMLKMAGAAGVGLLASACGQAAPAEPQVVEKVVTVEVEKEVSVEKVVTVEVEKEVEKQVEVEKVVTATPDSSAAKITVEGAFWVLQGKDFHESYNEYLRSKIAEYAGSQDWALDISYIAGFTSGTGEVEKIAASVQSGNPPDMILHTLSAVQLRNLYALDPVSDVVEQIEAVFGKAATQMYIDYNLDDQWWAVPYHQRSDGGWYRRDVFDEAGIDLQQIRQYSELAEACLEATKPDEEIYAWGMTVNRCGDGNYLINRIKTGYGAAWQDETGQYVAANSPEMIEAMNFIKDIYTNPDWEPMLPPGVLSWNDTANNEAYLGGKIAFTQNAGTVYANSVVTDNPVAPLTNFLKPPGGPAIQEFTAIHGKNWMVLRGAKNAAAAKDTILHFTTDLGRYDEMLASSPAYALPCYTDLWEMSEVAQGNEVTMQQKSSCLDESGIDSGIYPGPAQPAISAIDESGAWNDMVNAILTGTPVEQAVADAHARMVEIFKEFGLPGEKA
jgi:multiple sugar transport system substrate-binding protein